MVHRSAGSGHRGLGTVYVGKGYGGDRRNGAGRRRVPRAEYIGEMLTPRLRLGERMGNMEYGYLWYKPFGDREVYAAIGDSGNIIYINRENNVSVGMTGTFKPRIFDRVEFIERMVLPVIG